MFPDTKPQSNDYVFGIVEGSSTYYPCTPASPSPRRPVLILIATRYELSKLCGIMLALVLMAAFPDLLLGQELKLTPGLSVSEEYNDNIFLTTSGKRDDFITTLTPSLEISSRTERRDAKLSGGINWLEYAHYSGNDAVDWFTNGAFGYKLSPRLDFSAGAGYLRNSRPDQLDPTTGLSVNSGSGIQSYQTSGNYVLTERSKVSLSYGYYREDFDQIVLGVGQNGMPIHQELLGTRQHQAVGGFSYTLTPVLNLVEQVTYNRQLTDVSRVDNYSATIGLNRQFKEKWGFSMAAGGSYTHSDLNSTTTQTESSNNGGWVGNLSFTYQGEKLNSALSFNHNVNLAAGRTGSTESTGGSFTFGNRFTEEFSGSANISYYYNKSNQGQYSVQTIDENILDAGLSLHYDFNKDVAVEANYHYLHYDYIESQTHLDQNRVMLRLIVQHMFFL